MLANLVPVDIQLESHAAKFCIQASSTKTKAMTFKKKTVESVNEESLTFGDHKVEFVESVKVLGILIGDKLTFSQQFAAATSKAF